MFDGVACSMRSRYGMLPDHRPEATAAREDFQTTVEFLPAHRRQADETAKLIAAAEADGHHRLADNHRQVLGHLQRIIPASMHLGTPKTTTMTSPELTDRSAAMVAAAKDRHDATLRRAIGALLHLHAAGEEVTFAAADFNQ